MGGWLLKFVLATYFFGLNWEHADFLEGLKGFRVVRTPPICPICLHSYSCLPGHEHLLLGSQQRSFSGSTRHSLMYLWAHSLFAIPRDWAVLGKACYCKAAMKDVRK